MSGYLLDTNVISMFAPSKGALSDNFGTWLQKADAKGELFLSVITVHEIAKGITKLRQRGATARAEELQLWLTGLVTDFDDKIIGFDIAIARAAGQMEGIANFSGHSPGMADAIIAGTAAVHDHIVVTNNEKHFIPLRVPAQSPERIAKST